ncbi:tRNA dihydrouridine synthase [Borreliella afzelii]|uniref:tRNA dihydrouridine synthase n=1 Tax=Borreliella afzelii TaxID=29518 RepID=UPI00061A0EC3|nr:tRNA-dihydrouridine synthase [Borreliella afzelii]AJY72710.1 dihydrouridine synthase family protein [Borreliella afzelii K78]
MKFLFDIPLPIMILAPMEDVTDSVFRNLIHLIGSKEGEPHIYFTEFISVKGILNGSKQSIQHIFLKPNELNRPLIAQIWGNVPEQFYKAIEILGSMGFWGIDINMGCPKNKIIKKGVCSALINNKSLAKEIILASKEACAKFNLPLSVKTRHGFSYPEIDNWLGFLLGFGINMLTVYPRLAVNQSKGPVDFDIFYELVKLRNNISPSTLIIGNGDVLSLKDARYYVDKYLIDGIMFGRGIFKNLNLFKFSSKHFLDNNLNFRLNILKFHIKDFHATWGFGKDFNKLKKYFKIYFTEKERQSKYFSNLINSKTYEELFENLNVIDTVGDFENNEL